MHIYFVNKESRIQGPFDIIDANRNKIIQIGDVILHDTDDGICFLVVVSDTNKWNACHCVGKVLCDSEFTGNTLLFCFDGMSCRFGNIQAIERMKGLFQSSLIRDFFENALSILLYKCDFWDASCLYKIHPKVSLALSETSIVIKTNKNTNHTCNYLFETYLSQESLLIFRTLLNQNKPLREIYQEIRKQNPSEFRKALKEFLHDFPNLTIYDKA